MRDCQRVWKVVGADIDCQRAQLGLGHRQSVAYRIEIVSDFQFIDFSVLQDDLAVRVDEHSGVIQAVSGALDKTRNNKYAGLLRRNRESIRVRPLDGLRQAPRAWIRPAEVQAFWQDDQPTALTRRIADRFFRPLEVCTRLRAFDEDLRHPDTAFCSGHGVRCPEEINRQ
jgi:hypothetical protein